MNNGFHAERNDRTHDDDHTLQAAVNLHTAHPPSVLASSVHDVRHALGNLDQRFVTILVLVELPDVVRSDLLLQGSVEDRDDAGEPRGDARRERELEGFREGGHQVGELVPRFSLVNVIRQRIRSDTSSKVLAGLHITHVLSAMSSPALPTSRIHTHDLGHGLRSTMLIVRPSLGPRARISADPKDGRRILDVDERQEGSQEHLRVGRVASRVGDPGSRTSHRTVVQFWKIKDMSATIGNVLPACHPPGNP